MTVLTFERLPADRRAAAPRQAVRYLHALLAHAERAPLRARHPAGAPRPVRRSPSRWLCP